MQLSRAFFCECRSSKPNHIKTFCFCFYYFCLCSLNHSTTLTWYKAKFNLDILNFVAAIIKVAATTNSLFLLSKKIKIKKSQADCSAVAQVHSCRSLATNCFLILNSQFSFINKVAAAKQKAHIHSSSCWRHVSLRNHVQMHRDSIAIISNLLDLSCVILEGAKQTVWFHISYMGLAFYGLDTGLGFLHASHTQQLMGSIRGLNNINNISLLSSSGYN